MPKVWTDSWAIADTQVSPASGGQGTVRHVVNRTSEQQGALKQMHHDPVPSQERITRFRREARILRTFSQSGVPRVLDDNVDDESCSSTDLYFVCDWIEGKSLQQLFGGKGSTIDEAVAYALALTQIVSDCHTAGVIHRDIKPDNILVRTHDSAAVLVDFGTSSSAHIDDIETEVNQELGNRFLRMPDLSAGTKDRDDPRIDVTFLVGIFFFVLTGAAPRQLVDNELRSPHVAFFEKIPKRITSDKRWARVKRIFDVGFHPDVNKRFQSTADFAQMVESIAAGRDTSATVVSKVHADNLRALLDSEIHLREREMLKAIEAASGNLQNRLHSLALESGLVTRGNGFKPGDGFGFNLWFLPRQLEEPQVKVRHIIQIVGENRSYVCASVQIADGEMKQYYKGLAADPGGLDEALQGQAPEMFEGVAELLSAALSKPLGRHK